MLILEVMLLNTFRIIIIFCKLIKLRFANHFTEWSKMCEQGNFIRRSWYRCRPLSSCNVSVKRRRYPAFPEQSNNSNHSNWPQSDAADAFVMQGALTWAQASWNKWVTCIQQPVGSLKFDCSKRMQNYINDSSSGGVLNMGSWDLHPERYLVILYTCILFESFCDVCGRLIFLKCFDFPFQFPPHHCFILTDQFSRL